MGGLPALLASTGPAEEFQDSSVPRPAAVPDLQPFQSGAALRGLAEGNPGWLSRAEQLPPLAWMNDGALKEEPQNSNTSKTPSHTHTHAHTLH